MDKLRKLAASGKYVFHGSSTNNIEELEPRQAMSYGKPDGQPCIAAAEVVEPAIFMAVLGSRHTGGWGKGAASKGRYGFYISKVDYNRAKAEDWHGYVYVLPKQSFDHFSAWEWRAYVPVRPMQAIEVAFHDLPMDINIET